MDLAIFIDEKTYRAFAGTDWPSYADLITGNKTSDESINAEIDEFVKIMHQKYLDITIDGELIAEENQHRQQHVFYTKYVPNKQCRVPWETMGINSNGDLFICNSPSWIPKFVGNILKIDDIYTALNSDIALSIRNEIVANRYTYCNDKICAFFANLDVKEYTVDKSDNYVQPIIRTDDVVLTTLPTNLIFDFDYTCNFKCPSCRTEMINWNNDHIRRPINNKIVEQIKRLVIDKIENQPTSIRWAGGEPFISEVYLELLEYIISTGKRNIQNIIQTNGSYLKSKVVKNLLPYISELRISFDAATPETYAKTRVNGNWHKLLENVEYIKEQISIMGVDTKLTADFVVQSNNYKEIPQFVELCHALGIPHVNLQKMWNWGTWDDSTFAQHNVYTPEHSEYATVKKYIEISRINK